MKNNTTESKQFKEKIHTLCNDFRTDTEITLDEFLNAMNHLLYGEYPESQISQGCEELGIYLLPEALQAAFYCIVEYFLDVPMEPMDEGDCHTRASKQAFLAGVEDLQKEGLIMAYSSGDDLPMIPVAVSGGFLLSPKTCAMLLKGDDELIQSSVVSSFGEIIPWTDIRKKQLFFSPELSKRLRLVSDAVEKDDSIMKELQSKGYHGNLTFLFSGPPGTGKTEFVMQLARTRGRTIVKIDASKLDSRYFGEAPKKLRRMFLLLKYISALYETPPITFIDEADGLLGKRVSVNRSEDRETNTATNIILEELNDYRGVLFAATNHPENLDPAMERRFLLHVVFPNPDASVRAKIWKSKIPDLSASQAEELAQLFPFSGGYFDNVAKLYTIAQVINKKKPTFEEIKEFCVEQLGEKAKPVRKIGF